MKPLERIIIVDDSEATIRLTKGLLKEMGVANQIDCYLNGIEALNSLKDKTNSVPELILLDIIMPGMGGFDFLEEYGKLIPLLTNEFKPVIAVVSDYLDYENFTKSKKFKTMGVVDHIPKPIQREDLESLLEEYFI